MRRLPRGAEWILIGGLIAGLAGLVLRSVAGASAMAGFGPAILCSAVGVGALAVAALLMRQARRGPRPKKRSAGDCWRSLATPCSWSRRTGARYG